MVDRQGGELLLPDGKLSLLLPLVFATFTAAAYAWTAGFSAPTQRAIVMCVVGAICLFGGRKVPPLTILLLVLSISLAIDPLGVFNAGFWLSYLAVVVLFILYQHVVAKNTGNWRSRLKALCWVQIGMFVVMLPVQIMLFGGFSPVSPVANLFAIPWVSIVTVPGIIAALLTSPLGEISNILWMLADYSLYPVIKLAIATDGSWVDLPGYLVLWGIFVFLLVGIAALVPLKLIRILAMSLLLVVAGWKSRVLPRTVGGWMCWMWVMVLRSLSAKRVGQCFMIRRQAGRVVPWPKSLLPPF